MADADAEADADKLGGTTMEKMEGVDERVIVPVLEYVRVWESVFVCVLEGTCVSVFVSACVSALVCVSVCECGCTCSERNIFLAQIILAQQ